MLKIEATSINVCKALLVLMDSNVKARITDCDITIEGDVTPSVIRKLDLDILHVKKFDSSFPVKKLEEEAENEEDCISIADSTAAKKTSAQDKSVISISNAKLFMSSSIDKFKLFEISNKPIGNSAKIKDILEAFGFDMEKDGIRYLSLAIFRSIVLPDMPLTNLCREVVRAENFNDVSANEVEYVIATLVKENFRTKESLAGEFIRLVKYIITTKGGILNEIFGT